MFKDSMVASTLAVCLTFAVQPAFAMSEDEENIAGALVILGTAALLHGQHHYRDGYAPEDEKQTADFEAGYRDGLHNYSFDTSYGSRSYSEGQSYNEGYNAGQHERAASHSHQHHRAEGHNATVPRPATNACVDKAAYEWGVPRDQVHVTRAKKEAAKDLFLEMKAGRFTAVCEVAPDGQLYDFKVGNL